MTWLIVTLLFTYLVYRVWDFLRRTRSEWLDEVHKRCVFITGCDSGFGRLLAGRLDSLGVPVFAGCLTDAGCRQLKEECSPGLHTLQLDVASPDSIRQAYGYVKSHLPPNAVLWGVVNNAGVFGTGGPAEIVPRQEYIDMMMVNFLGVVEVTSTFLPLVKASRGRIVNISSVAGFIPSQGFAAYGASKYAVRGYTDILRLEKASWGIGVSCVNPGPFGTNIWNTSTGKEKAKAKWADIPAELREEYGEDYYERTAKHYAEICETGKESTSLVVDAYFHALFSLRPFAHYYPGTTAGFLLLLTWLPRGWSEAIIRKVQVPLPIPKALQLR